LDGVTLDLKLAGEMTFRVADVLAARNVPFVFLTGYGAADVPARHANVTRVENLWHLVLFAVRSKRP